MKRWKLAAVVLGAVLAGPAVDRSTAGGRAHAEGEEDKMLQYYEMLFSTMCKGKCTQGPYCCQIVPLQPNPQG